MHWLDKLSLCTYLVFQLIHAALHLLQHGFLPGPEAPLRQPVLLLQLLLPAAAAAAVAAAAAAAAVAAGAVMDSTSSSVQRQQQKQAGSGKTRAPQVQWRMPLPTASDQHREKGKAENAAANCAGSRV